MYRVENHPWRCLSYGDENYYSVVLLSLGSRILKFRRAEPSGLWPLCRGPYPWCLNGNKRDQTLREGAVSSSDPQMRKLGFPQGHLVSIWKVRSDAEAVPFPRQHHFFDLMVGGQGSGNCYSRVWG